LGIVEDKHRRSIAGNAGRDDNKLTAAWAETGSPGQARRNAQPGVAFGTPKENLLGHTTFSFGSTEMEQL
jgi:hypothetical protein